MFGVVIACQAVESAITEPSEAGNISKPQVCPRVVSLNKAGKNARIPVRLFNMSTKILTIPPKSDLCQLHEVKVLRSPALAKEGHSSVSVNVNQQTVSAEKVNKPMVDLSKSVMTEDQKGHVHDFLSQWQEVFFHSPTDLGRTNLVEHEIPLKDETPFKEPYRRIPPGIIEEFREHL